MTEESVLIPTPDSVAIQCEYEGFPLVYTATLSSEDTALPELIAFLKATGIKPRVAAAPAAGGGGAPAQSAVCPVHGGDKIGPGYQGRGKECKVISDTEPTWPYKKPWTGRDGRPRYSCAWQVS